MIIHSFAEAHAALREFYAQPMAKTYNLDRMRQIMASLGNPQDTYRVIHVAGTSGKTSTAYFVASLLQTAGFKTGLTVSPHVDEVNERVQINLQPLAEAAFCQELGEFLELISKGDITPSYFECMVAFAYWEFARQQVEYAVVEVGLGGLLDGTNVVTRADKVCVITDIGLDHTEILGDTLAKIAAQKAGIIQPGNTVYMFEQGTEVMTAIDTACKQAGDADLRIVPAVSRCKITNLPLFQERNFCLASEVVDGVLRGAGKPILGADQLQQAATVYIPARMETITRGDKTIIIDGAHNAQKLQTLFDSIRGRYPEQPIAALAGFVDGDSFRLQHGLDVLMANVAQLIVTSFYTEKDFPRHSVPPAELVAYCHQQGWSEIAVEEDPAQALERLLARPEQLLLITGSFYLLNHIRPLLLDGNE